MAALWGCGDWHDVARPSRDGPLGAANVAAAY